MTAQHELARRFDSHADRLRALARRLASDGRATHEGDPHPELVHWQGVLDLVMNACPEVDAVAFVREGEYWTIGGRRRFRLRDSKGLGYLARLIAEPGREFHALDLASDGATVARLDQTTLSPLDAEARRAYAERIADLETTLERAESDGDLARASVARDEIEWIRSEIAAAYGLGGSARPGPTPAERARQSVTKAIRVAIGRIADEDPELARHLDRGVSTGTFCSYDPHPGAELRWET